MRYENMSLRNINIRVCACAGDKPIQKPDCFANMIRLPSPRVRLHNIDRKIVQMRGRTWALVLHANACIKYGDRLSTNTTLLPKHSKRSTQAKFLCYLGGEPSKLGQSDAQNASSPPLLHFLIMFIDEKIYQRLHHGLHSCKLLQDWFSAQAFQIINNDFVPWFADRAAHNVSPNSLLFRKEFATLCTFCITVLKQATRAVQDHKNYCAATALLPEPSPALQDLHGPRSG